MSFFFVKEKIVYPSGKTQKPRLVSLEIKSMTRKNIRIFSPYHIFLQSKFHGAKLITL